MKATQARTLPVLILVSMLFAACRPNTEPVDQSFFVAVDQSRLFIRLAGNPDGPLLINLHGGPGAFSGFDRETYRPELEPEYLVAYLDQRGGGRSDPEPDSTKLNMEQFVADLDLVIDSLRKGYPGKPVNLIGTSWGGSLGLLYLIAHPGKVNAFACVSGKADGVYPIQALIRHERALADSLLQTDLNPKQRQQINQMLQELPAIEKSNMEAFYESVNQLKHDYPKLLGFNVYWANDSARQQAALLGKDTAYYARAGYTMAGFDSAMQRFDYVNRVFRNTAAYNHLNILDQLPKVNTPTLVIQGAEDYSIGPRQAEMIYAGLGSLTEGQKKLTIVTGAAHNLNMEAPEVYFTAIRDFFKKHSQ
ncbi:alpha/beta fold hydrolase [Niabella terrae]